MKQFSQKIRIIPKLEIKNEFLIKGVRFEGLRKIGNPVDFANKYFKDGADQINLIGPNIYNWTLVGVSASCVQVEDPNYSKSWLDGEDYKDALGE